MEVLLLVIFVGWAVLLLIAYPKDFMKAVFGPIVLLSAPIWLPLLCLAEALTKNSDKRPEERK